MHKIMNMDTRSLDGVAVFASVVTAGNFARAGQSLGLTQSAVSRSVARLESRLGVRLLERTTRSLALTVEGRKLYESAAPLLDQLADSVTAVSGAATTPQGVLRVNTDSYFSSLIFAPHAARFLALYPEITLDLFTTPELGDLIGNGFDLAVRFGAPPDSSLIARKLLDTRVLTVASPRYLKRHGYPASPRDLANHQAIQFRDPATGKPFTWEFHRGRQVVSIQPRHRLLVNDVSSLLTAALSGAGIAQALSPCVRDHIHTGRLIELFPDWPDERFPLYALYPSRRLSAARVRVFLEFIQQIAAEHESQP